VPATVHRVPRFGFVNAYLVVEDDGLTLVDTAVPGSRRAILRAAADLGAPIVRIVITHAHHDHVGSLDALAAALTDAEVLVSAREARLLRGDRSLDPGEPDAEIRLIASAKTTADRTLTAGDRVGSLVVHAAPGHTPGQIALMDPRDQTLICADAYSTLGGVATSAHVRPLVPIPALATWHRPTALRSAQALRDLEPARLAPGHGRIVQQPLAAMDRAIARGT
jgi:glyoxylase-like metal-dependent hydrolase (beta-lactamase superfamily II)